MSQMKIAFEEQLGAELTLSSPTADIPKLDDSSDTSSLTIASTEAASIDADEDKSNKPLSEEMNVLIWERLYNEAKEKQLDGKQRRLEIEENIAKKHAIPDFSTCKKMSLLEAEEFYRKSLKRAMEKDEKLAEMRELENFYSNKKTSLSQAEEFYRKAMKRAMEKEDKLAEMRDRNNRQ